MMDVWTEIAVPFVLPVLGAAVAGGIIGFEREYRGRAAGLRTHILVALTSALLMLAAVHQVRWLSDTPHDVIRIDPVRMAHGVLTGIGVLCGGVIFRQGLSVHGLTTAASLWITSAIGILYGIGFYGLAIGGTLATLLVLAGLRVVDHKVPHLSIFDIAIRYRRAEGLPEQAFRELAGDLKVELTGISHKLLDRGEMVEVAGTLRGKHPVPTDLLARRLSGDDRVLEFEITPRKD
ncbi:MAG: MgtC/SapB family protein [Phenylobacterium sp.]